MNGRLVPTGLGGRLGAVAPVPFVGAAAILVALIVFTPVLLASGPSPLAVQPVLAVYRVPGGSTTSFMVTGTDPTVPYRWLNLSLGTGFAWNGTCPSRGLSWTYANGTNTTGAVVVAGAVPVVVNATVVYVHNAGRTVYAGALAFELVGANTSSESLVYVACPWTPTVSPGGSWTVSLGTLPIDLVNYGSGGPP